jgi:hypothetical protein
LKKELEAVKFVDESLQKQLTEAYAGLDQCLLALTLVHDSLAADYVVQREMIFDLSLEKTKH